MADTDRKQQYSIGDLCREFQVTARAVRFYQAKGILFPARRAGGLTRVFSRRDRARLHLTLRGKRAGFTLVEIKEMLDLYDRDGGAELQKQVGLEKGRQQIKFMRQQIAELTAAVEELEKDCLILEQGGTPGLCKALAG